MIGQLIKDFRKKKNLTLRDLAMKSGVSYSQISKIERGANIPTEETLIKLKNALDINVDHIDISYNQNDINRFEILLRDNFTCQLCGQSAPNTQIEVSQIVPNENYITLCRSCENGRIALIKKNGLSNDVLYKKYLKRQFVK